MYQFGFDLQLFADDEGMTVDEALSVINGDQVAAEQPEPEVNENDEQPEQPEQDEQTDDEPQEAEETPAEQPTIDYAAKVKYKANGQEVEMSIQELIAEAQKGRNYERHMQELKAKQQEVEQQQKQQEQKKDSPADKLAKRQNQIAEYGPVFEREFGEPFNQYDPAHLMEMFEHYSNKRTEEQVQKQQESAKYQEYEAAENKFVSTVQALSAEPDFQAINQFAEKQMHLLPSQGKVAEYKVLSVIHEKIMLRDQYFADMNQFGRSQVIPQPFTAAEVEVLTSFYNKCREDFKSQKATDEIKASVPKAAPIKPTVKTESAAPAAAATHKSLDVRKIREMDIDDIAKLL